MFGSLKRKLQEAIQKVSKTISKDEPKQEPVAEKVPVEEIVEEAIDEKIEKLQELEEKIEEDKISSELRENIVEQEQILDEELDKKEESVKIIKKPELEEEKPVVHKPEIIQKHELIIKHEPIVHKYEKVVEEQPKKSIFSGIMKKVSEKKLSESDIAGVLKELQIVMLESDVALEVAEKLCDDIKSQLVDKAVKRGKVDDTIKEALKKSMFSIMNQEGIDIDEKIRRSQKPFTIVFVGFNGSGKTTTMAKFAYKFRKYKPVLAAGDTFRAASIEQIETHAKRIGASVIKHTYGADSAAVIFDAKKHAEAIGSRLVLADTAGRSHSNTNLMDELKKVIRVNSPDLKILVLDALTGNDIYDQARLFDEAVGIDAIILTKADVYDKGGAALSAAYTIKKPVIYLGVGQEYEDLKEFNPKEIVDSLLS